MTSRRGSADSSFQTTDQGVTSWRALGGRDAPALGPVLFLLVVVVVFFSPAIFQNKTFYAFDTLSDHLPWSSEHTGHRSHNPLITDPVNLLYTGHLFFKQSLDRSQLPLWYNLNMCGLPHLLGFSSQLHPAMFLANLALPSTLAHDTILALHLLGAGLFLFFFLRQLGLSSLPALIGAVCWMFNGYVMVWLEFELIPMLAATLPAILLFMERWLARRSRADLLLLTGAVGLAIACGFVHLIIYQLLFAGAYLVMRCLPLIIRQGVSGFFAGQGRTLGLCAAAGALISGPLIASYLAIADDLQRPVFAFSDLFRHTGQLPAGSLLTMVFPDFFGSPTMGYSLIPRVHTTQTYNNYNELCIYAGVLPLFLAPVCGFGGDHRRPVLFFAFSALVCLTMAMGSVLYLPLARFVPGLDVSTPTRILFLFGFAVSVLTAFGAEAFYNGKLRPNRRLVFLVWALPVLLTVAVFHAVQQETVLRWLAAAYGWIHEMPLVAANFSSAVMTWRQPLLVGLTFLSLTGGLLAATTAHRRGFLLLALGLLLFDLVCFGRHYNTVTDRTQAFPPTAGLSFLQQEHSKFRVVSFGNFMHNTLGPFGIEDIGGYFSLYPKRHAEFLHLSQHGAGTALPSGFSRWTRFTRFGSPLLDAANVTYLLLPPGIRIENPIYEPVYDGEIAIYRNTRAFERAYFVTGALVAGSRRQAYEMLGQAGREALMTTVILEETSGRPDPGAHRGGDAPQGPSAVRIDHYSANRVAVTVDTGVDGYLVLSDAFAPGWVAAVDGQRRPVLRANYIMRAVALEAGNHHVVFTYRPYGMIAAVAGAAAGWLLLLAGAGATLARRPGPGSAKRRLSHG